ncbi:ABC transporter ATP-binding protein [Shewanella sp. NIFS-20-20]|uniref:ABC transporter ATP-binding protein n=1 Tax=Shewanella sp. NIFS-20-20 TaxID=2853806 RepID=UPI001C48EEDC|nr:ABC transporter ATP-binding protein [Shewanella sp. NIFS-20-20]MBV7314970.1 ABC transporter ATP-binding protein/permease [Shewanella sp. NIFS-20-20]
MFKLFESWTDPLPEKEVTAPPSTLVKFCLFYTQGFEKPLLIMSMLTAVMAMLEVSLFGFMGQLVDWLATKDPQTLLAQEGRQLMFMSLIVLVALPLLTLLHSLIVHQTLLGNYPMSIRLLAHKYLLRQSLAFYQQDFAGRVATKVMQTSLAVRETVMKLLDVLVYISVYFISMLVMIASSDWRMVIPMLCWLGVYTLIQWIFIPKLKRVSEDQAEARSSMTGRIVDSYTNISTIKLFAHSEQEDTYAKQGMWQFLTTVHRQMRLVTWLNVSVQVSNYLLAFAVAALAIGLWIDNAISIGAIAVAISLALRLNGMSMWIMWELSSLFENIGTVSDGMATLSQPITIVDAPDAKDIVITHGAIDFKGVYFSYQSAMLFNNLDLSIRAGEKVGIVGRSGAGKSTLVNLLLRFYDIQQGVITIDNQAIDQVKQDSLRSSIGMITQDTSLLHRSVRDNILYGKPDASDAELRQAMIMAQVDGFISELSDPQGNIGLDAMVGERGVKLSGGQRQRIAIARVLLKNAPILVMDEATSALDSEAEVAIQESLTQLVQNKTVIAIAHRLSTIAAMDRLIVIDNGTIIEQGSHQQLLASNGVYAQLWAHQTGGFLGTE